MAKNFLFGENQKAWDSYYNNIMESWTGVLDGRKQRT